MRMRFIANILANLQDMSLPSMQARIRNGKLNSLVRVLHVLKRRDNESSYDLRSQNMLGIQRPSNVFYLFERWMASSSSEHWS